MNSYSLSSSQHIYFIVTGLSIGYYNYGETIVHVLIGITVPYVILFLASALKIHVIGTALVFLFAMVRWPRV